MDIETTIGADKLERMRYVVRSGAPQFLGALHALRIVRLVDEWAETPAVADEAAKCPSLAEGILKLSRSSLYGNAKIETLQSAIEFLGYEELRRAMMTLAISAWSPNTGDTTAFDMQAFRRRAIVHGYLSEAIARHLKWDHTTKYFLAGTFADIGYMFVTMHTPFSVRHIALQHRRTPGISLLQTEHLAMGYTHSELSAVAAMEFGFEPELVEAIRCHPDPRATEGEPQRIAAVLDVASAVLDKRGIVVASSLPTTPMAPGSLELLGIELERVEGQLEGVLDRSSVVMGAVSSTMAA